MQKGILRGLTRVLAPARAAVDLEGAEPRVGDRPRGAALEDRDAREEVAGAQFARPAALHPVNLRALSPFQRALILIDGTVTRFIEAYAMEPLDVLRLEQTTRSLTTDSPWLELSHGDVADVRRVLLRGRVSRKVYVYASSLLVPSRWPPAARDRLEGGTEGIGRIVESAKMETRREILWYGRERVRVESRGVSEAPDEWISRAYRIIWHGRPIALINERFPQELEALPSHH